jgi:hypothetical protein
MNMNSRHRPDDHLWQTRASVLVDFQQGVACKMTLLAYVRTICAAYTIYSASSTSGSCSPPAHAEPKIISAR